MAAVRIGPKHQVVIPKDVFHAMRLNVGDYLEVGAQGGNIVYSPMQLAPRAPVVRLTKIDQRTLMRANTKIRNIQHSLLRSKGLTTNEVTVAVKVGLIDSDQAYWWTEEWQKGERNAERELRAGIKEGA